MSTNREVDPEVVPRDPKGEEEEEAKHEREASETEETTEPNVKESERVATRVLEKAQVECPPCICMMGDHQRDTYLLGGPTAPVQERNISQTTPQPTIASTMTSTTSKTSTTTTTTTAKMTTKEAPSPTHRPIGCESDLEEDQLCLSESCIMAAGTILTSLDRR